MKTRELAFVLSIVLLCTLNSVLASSPREYVLEGTEVHTVRSINLKREYEIFVSLPDSYYTSQQHYPVLFITDPNYAFPLIRSINRRIRNNGSNNGKDIQEFILIGLSYAKGETPAMSRSRDYTPALVKYAKDKVQYATNAQYGGAEQYRRYIVEEIFPFVRKHYRADMSKKIYAGHSYGGLFGLYVLFNDPTMFDAYILGSPSLWFCDYFILNVERQYAATHKDLPAKVLMSIGDKENDVALNAPEHYEQVNVDMLQDMEKFIKTLRLRHYHSFAVVSEIVRDEDHLSIYPSFITRGLCWALEIKK